MLLFCLCCFCVVVLFLESASIHNECFRVAMTGGDQAEEIRGCSMDQAGRGRTEVWSQVANGCCFCRYVNIVPVAVW